MVNCVREGLYGKVVFNDSAFRNLLFRVLRDRFHAFGKSQCAASERNWHIARAFGAGAYGSVYAG